jgi:hypothetical protein
MIDRVAAAARGAPLKANQLRQKARMVKQVDLARVDGRQQIAIEIRLRLLRGLVADAVVAESLFRPFSDQLGTPANKKNVEADEDGVGPLDIIPPLVAQRFCAMARTCRSRMSATWPLSGVIRTLSPQRPRAEFDPERTWASARRSAAPRAPVCAPGRQRTPHPPRTRISVPGAPTASPVAGP